MKLHQIGKFHHPLLAYFAASEVFYVIGAIPKVNPLCFLRRKWDGLAKIGILSVEGALPVQYDPILSLFSQFKEPKVEVCVLWHERLSRLLSTAATRRVSLCLMLLFINHNIFKLPCYARISLIHSGEKRRRACIHTQHTPLESHQAWNIKWKNSRAASDLIVSVACANAALGCAHRRRRRRRFFILSQLSPLFSFSSSA